MEHVGEDFDVVLHEYLAEQLGRDADDAPLWSDVLFRDDCTLQCDARGKPYHSRCSAATWRAW